MAAPSMTLARVYQCRYDCIRDWIMCDVFRKVNGHLLWVGRMCEADAMARVCRHRDEVYIYGDIPF